MPYRPLTIQEEKELEEFEAQEKRTCQQGRDIAFVNGYSFSSFKIYLILKFAIKEREDNWIRLFNMYCQHVYVFGYKEPLEWYAEYKCELTRERY